MILDLTALQDSIAALERSLGYLQSDLAHDPGVREQFRAAAIQAFEFPLPPDVQAALADEFDESDLAFKVDLVDWATTGETFREIIRHEHRTIQLVRRARTERS